MLPLFSDPRLSRCGVVRRAALALLLAVSSSLASSTVRAQQPRGVVTGSVRAADESRLAGARVEIVGNVARPGSDQATTVTEGDGAFRFEGVPDGTARLVVRRLGFRPETLAVDVPQIQGGDIVVMLERIAQPLAPIVVREHSAGPLPSGFERRRQSGFGHYITRADIDKRKPQRTTDLLRGMAGVTLNGTDGAISPRFRSIGGGSCEPSYFFNGAPVSRAIDLDAMNPQNIESLEVYNGVATVPAALRSSAATGACGAIVVWTRMGDDATVADDDVRDGPGADSLARRVASGWAYTADQVELTATPLPGMGPAPGYPEALLKTRTPGRVVAEFVVDEQGRVDESTVNIVSSTHPALSAAVRAAVGRARFTPAYAKGHVVRQVVQLPFVFSPANGATSN